MANDVGAGQAECVRHDIHPRAGILADARYDVDYRCGRRAASWLILQTRLFSALSESGCADIGREPHGHDCTALPIPIEGGNTNDELVLTQSTIKTWDRCRRKWWLDYYRGLEKPNEYRSPFTIGNLVHDALDAYYTSTYSNGELLDPVAYIKELSLNQMTVTPEFGEAIAKDASLATIMVEGYLEWLEETGVDSDFEHVDPERTIKAQLISGRPPGGCNSNPSKPVPPVFLLGKLDGKVRTRDGWIGFLEHKTVGNFTDLPSFAHIDRQLLSYDLLEYLELLETYGKVEDEKPPTDGALLNMLRKVRRGATSKPPFYERMVVKHNIHQLRNHWRHVVSIALDIQRATARLDAGEDHHVVVTPMPASDCRWSCQFFDICGMFDDGSDVESVIEFEFQEHDPLERYKVKVDPTTQAMSDHIDLMKLAEAQGDY